MNKVLCRNLSEAIELLNVKNVYPIYWKTEEDGEFLIHNFYYPQGTRDHGTNLVVYSFPLNMKPVMTLRLPQKERFLEEPLVELIGLTENRYTGHGWSWPEHVRPDNDFPF